MKVISRIEKISYFEGGIDIILSNNSLHLWHGPCSKNAYNKLAKIDEFVLWEWTYFKDTKEIYKCKILKNSYYNV